MGLFTLDELDQAVKIVWSSMPATPAHSWPLLSNRAGVEVVVKHENHTPTGSFKARGGMVYIEHLHSIKELPKGYSSSHRCTGGQFH